MQTQRIAQSEIKSRKVRRILKLEARAAKLQARYDKAVEKLEPLRRRLEALQKEARAIEGSLSGGQLGELRRARESEP
ncbi:MAG: hypothetical protein WAP47_08065 [Candidatus Rokuibacteriota bacterium]